MLFPCGGKEGVKHIMKRTILWVIFLCGIGLSAQTPDHQIEFRGEGTGKDYTEARNAAMNDVAAQIGRYIFAFIKSDLNEQLTYQSENSKTISDSEFTSSETRVFSEMLVSNIAIDKEFPMPRQADGKYRIILSCLMSESGLEAQKNRYISGVAERYAARIRYVKEHSASVYEALSGYEGIRVSLENNPVTQSIAVFFNNDSGKQENCYDYAVSEIQRIGSSVTFRPFPPALPSSKHQRSGNRA
jgi:hypothetical protein